PERSRLWHGEGQFVHLIGRDQERGAGRDIWRIDQGKQADLRKLFGRGGGDEPQEERSAVGRETGRIANRRRPSTVEDPQIVKTGEKRFISRRIGKRRSEGQKGHAPGEGQRDRISADKRTERRPGQNLAWTIESYRRLGTRRIARI